MIKTTRIMLIAFVLFGTAYSAMADRGIGKKSKSAKVTLNISTPSTLRNSLSLNLKNGLRYTGSMLVNQQNTGNTMMKSSLVTYQKGNTTYIIPYKQKIVMPEIKQGYTGMKLIIRPNH
jgi:hypothetical protein